MSLDRSYGALRAFIIVLFVRAAAFTRGDDGQAVIDAGAELMQPLSLAVVGGVSVSTLLELFVVAGAYVLAHRAGDRANTWLTGSEPVLPREYNPQAGDWLPVALNVAGWLDPKLFGRPVTYRVGDLRYWYDCCAIRGGVVASAASHKTVGLHRLIGEQSLANPIPSPSGPPGRFRRLPVGRFPYVRRND